MFDHITGGAFLWFYGASVVLLFFIVWGARVMVSREYARTPNILELAYSKDRRSGVYATVSTLVCPPARAEYFARNGDVKIFGGLMQQPLIQRALEITDKQEVPEHVYEKLARDDYSRALVQDLRRGMRETGMLISPKHPALLVAQAAGLALFLLGTARLVMLVFAHEPVWGLLIEVLVVVGILAWAFREKVSNPTKKFRSRNYKQLTNEIRSLDVSSRGRS
ncbi:hypothetical protein GCM10009585_02560 [Brevibacterium paucivorans]|uniref:hypothetical protein n=1 Tax=Brevibacterium paucivorans TaxID=170994 RepID=UPI0031D89B57